MNTNIALNHVVRPTLELLGKKYQSKEAEVLLMAIAIQESRFMYRKQRGGPARGYWQFESGGGVYGVLAHRASRTAAKEICEMLDYLPTQSVVYAALADNDILSCAFARLLLWTDPKALPAIGDKKAAWEYYLRVWRPGKPRKEHWEGAYLEARNVVGV